MIRTQPISLLKLYLLYPNGTVLTLETVAFKKSFVIFLQKSTGNPLKLRQIGSAGQQANYKIWSFFFILGLFILSDEKLWNILLEIKLLWSVHHILALKKGKTASISLKTTCNTVQANNCEIVVNFYHISHKLTWYSVIVPKFTRIYPVWST